MLELSDGDDQNLSLEFDKPSTTHRHPVLGLLPGRNYEATINVIDIDGNRQFTRESVRLQTPALPDDFPPIEVLASDPPAMEPGFTMFTVIARKKNEQAVGGDYLVFVDDLGRVAWYLPGKFSSVLQQTDGRLLAMTADPSNIVEIDMFGNVMRTWFASQSVVGPPGGTAVATRDFHHDVVTTGDDTYLTLVREMRRVDDFPTDEEDRSRTDSVLVRDEPVLEFAADGSVIGQWNLIDILEPTRVGYDGTTGVPEDADWVHANGVWYDDSDDTMLVSLRHQDAVIKISRETGKLRWILGPHDNWFGLEEYLLFPSGADFEWSYHQHSPKMTPAGTLLLFDNGNHRASPFTGESPLPAADNYSRAVEYRIDEERKEISQVWQWQGSMIGEQLYSPIVGDADHMPLTDNVLISFAGLCDKDGFMSNNAKECRLSIRIIEIARDEPGRPVFDLRIQDPSGDISWVSYRSERIASLYPAN